MSDDRFTTIRQHWAHFLERDIPRDAPPVQVDAMRKAFAAGAISGLQLSTFSTTREQLQKHTSDIVALNRGNG